MVGLPIVLVIVASSSVVSSKSSSSLDEDISTGKYNCNFTLVDVTDGFVSYRLRQHVACVDIVTPANFTMVAGGCPETCRWPGSTKELSAKKYKGVPVINEQVFKPRYEADFTVDVPVACICVRKERTGRKASKSRSKGKGRSRGKGRGQRGRSRGREAREDTLS